MLRQSEKNPGLEEIFDEKKGVIGYIKSFSKKYARYQIYNSNLEEVGEWRNNPIRRIWDNKTLEQEARKILGK